VALHFMYYNFCCVHQTPRVTAAMEAGLSSHVWGIAEIINLLDMAGKKARSRGPSNTFRRLCTNHA